MNAAMETLAGRLLDRPDVRTAIACLHATDERTLAEQGELTLIAAPPFGEARRGRRMADLMRAAGLDSVEVDTEGNVVGRTATGGSGSGTPLVVAAHLDTVFPDGTPLRLQRDGSTLHAPGICDDGRGLAALLAIARAVRAGGISLHRPLMLVATVGEEGSGNLRGVRRLFSAGGAVADGCAGFVSLDGAGVRKVVHVGVGSIRTRLRVAGSGGHSWVDWGIVNPVHEIARVAASLADLPLPAEPRTTLTVARIGGGTSINAIAEDAWLEFEVRSVDHSVLGHVHREALATIRRVLTGGGTAGQWRVEEIGRRPAGRTAEDTPLVRAALAATRAFGFAPRLADSSTDANLPMSIGVPAITLGAGGEAGGMHTRAEWFRNVHGPEGIARALLTLLLTDQVLQPVTTESSAS